MSGNNLLLNVPAINYLSDRFLEKVKEETPEYVVSWACGFEGFSDENGYLVEVDGEYGFLFVHEYWHTGMKDEIARDFVRSNPKAKSSSILSGIFRMVNRLILTGVSAKRLGFGTGLGALGSHELYVFFPVGSSNEEYRQFWMEFLKYHKEVFSNTYKNAV